jgi:hypothetical protein
VPNIITAVYPPRNVADLFLDKTKWEWIAGVTEAPDEDTFGQDGHAMAQIQGFLKDHRFLHDCLAYFVGYSYVQEKTLRRICPAWHPRWPWLRCTNVSIKGVKFDGQEEDPGPNHFAHSLPLPIYERYRFLCLFEGLNYNVKDDAQVADYSDLDREWQRFISVEPKDNTEIFTQEGGFYQYVSPSGYGIQEHRYLGPALQVRAERTGLTVTAYNIASDFVLNSSDIPTKFVRAKSLANKTEFLGQPPGTMLLDTFEITKKPQYVATESLNALQFQSRVKMNFVFTDPPATDPLETHRGWLLCPGPGGIGWYFAQSPATILGVPIPGGARSLYGQCEMRALLTHHSLDDLAVT